MQTRNRGNYTIAGCELAAEGADQRFPDQGGRLKSAATAEMKRAPRLSMVARYRGTGISNPSPSSGESAANPVGAGRSDSSDPRFNRWPAPGSAHPAVGCGSRPAQSQGLIPASVSMTSASIPGMAILPLPLVTRRAARPSRRFAPRTVTPENEAGDNLAPRPCVRGTCKLFLRRHHEQR
jgi:hypothetical protein